MQMSECTLLIIHLIIHYFSHFFWNMSSFGEPPNMFLTCLKHMCCHNMFWPHLTMLHFDMVFLCYELQLTAFLPMRSLEKTRLDLN